MYLNRTILLTAALLSLPVAGQAEALQTSLSVDEFENHFVDGRDLLAWSAEFSVGSDNNALVVSSEGGHRVGDIEEHELRVFHDFNLSGQWAVQWGWRGDLETDYDRHWLFAGLGTTLPLEIEATTTLFAGSHGRSGLQLELSREVELGSRLTLSPEMTINAYGHNDEETGVGSGLSDIEVAVRLGYAVTPRFVPYIGAVWQRGYGQTADYLAEAGEEREESLLLLGCSFSF